MPTENEWITFADWGRKWGKRVHSILIRLVSLTARSAATGGIISVTLLGQPLIVVNSAKVMEELDKKGSIYSDRPR